QCRRVLDRLVGRKLMSNACDSRHQRIWISVRSQEQPAASILFERSIDRHGWSWRRVRVIGICDDADNTARFRADADELCHHRIRPSQMPVQRVLTWKQLVRQARVDNDNTLRAITIGFIEVSAGDNRNAQSGKKTRRYIPAERVRVVLR